MPTLSDLRARVRLDRALKSTTLLSVADLDILIKEGAVQLANDGDAFIRKAQWSSIASTQTYVLSGASPKVSNFLDIYWEAGGLTYNNGTTTVPLKDLMRSEAWLDLNIPGWQDASASDTITHCYLSHNSDGDLVFGVYPKSSTAISNAFSLYYKSRGTDMSATTDYPWVAATLLTHTEPYQVGIAFYAQWQAHELFTLNKAVALHYKEKYLEQALGLKEAQRRIFAAELEGLTADAQIVAADSFGSL